MLLTCLSRVEEPNPYLFTMSDDSEIKKLWRVKKTLMQLCHDRGYLVTHDELNESLSDFKQLYKCKSSESPLRQKLTMLFSHISSSADQIYIFFPLEPTLRKSQIDSFVHQMQESKVSKAIFVIQEFLTPLAKKALNDHANFNLEVFRESELLVNIMDHELVPKHIVLSNQEKEALFAKYNLTEHLLMRLQTTDPVARYYGLKRGQVVKILRNSETAGRYVCYRLVC